MGFYLGTSKRHIFLNGLLLTCQYFMPRIPAEYQEVEYIEAPSGVGAYIDLGFTFDTASIVEIDYVEYSTNNGRYIFGATENSGKLRCLITDTSGKGSIGYGSTSSAYVDLSLDNSEYLDNQFNFYRLTLRNGYAEFKNVSIDYAISKTTQGTYTMTNNLYLFAQNYNGSIRFGGGSARVRAFRYYDKNDNLVCDLIPCYRKNDYEIGMYDVVRNVFLTNIGDGAFVKGEVVNGGDNNDQESGNTGEGYQEVEWICALNGANAYIDLGFAFDTKARVEMSQYIYSNTNTYIFGAAENSGTLRCMLSAPYSSKLSLYGSNGTSYIGVQSVSYVDGLNEYEMIFESGNLKLTNKTNGGTASLTTQGTYSMTNNLYLLGQNYNGTARFGGERKIGYFRYYDKNDILICDLIPCFRRSDGEIGMYDKVRNIFLTNAGNTSFTKGANV